VFDLKCRGSVCNYVVAGGEGDAKALISVGAHDKIQSLRNLLRTCSLCELSVDGDEVSVQPQRMQLSSTEQQTAAFNRDIAFEAEKVEVFEARLSSQL
jgi:hypothetical protein